MHNKIKVKREDYVSTIDGKTNYFSTITLPDTIVEGGRSIVFKKPLSLKCHYIGSEDYGYKVAVFTFDFGLEHITPLEKEHNFILMRSDDKTDEEKIAFDVIFDLFHAFFHCSVDPNYTDYHWALYGNLKDRVIIKDEEDRDNIPKQIDLNKIYCENCLTTMDRMNDGFVDLTVTSPPYDNLRDYNGYSFEFEKVANELYRVTKEGGVVVWVVADATIDGSESGTSFKQALYFQSIGFNLHDTMIYLKDNPPPVGGSNRYYQHFEYMFVFSKGKPKTFNPIMTQRRNKWNDKRTERVKGFNRNKQGEFTQKKVSLTGDVKIGNVWKYVVGGGNSVPYGVKNPAAFPEKLAEDNILSWSNKGDIVYDPFLGSGTTAKMAKVHERNYIGSEISEEYVNSAIERVK